MKKTSLTIKSLLLDKGITQRQLAAHLGMSESQLSHTMAKGRFSQDVLQSIAKFLSTDVGSLMQYVNRSRSMVSIGTDEGCDEKVELLTQLIALKDDVIKAKDALIQQLMTNATPTPPHQHELKKERNRQ